MKPNIESLVVWCAVVIVAWGAWAAPVTAGEGDAQQSEQSDKDKSDKDKKDKKDKPEAPEPKDAKGAPEPKGAKERPLALFATYSQNEWGQSPEENEKAAAILEKHFAKVFPNGLRVGSRKKSGLFFVFDSAESIRTFLPVDGTPGVMTEASRTGLRDAGGLAGQLVAARLNVGFNKMALAAQKAQEGVEQDLGRLVFTGEVHKKLIGMTANEAMRIADRAIAGELGDPKKASEKTVDVDRDGTPDVDLVDLREALRVINWNFHAGDDIKRSLGLNPAADDAVARERDFRRAAAEDGDDDDVGATVKREVARAESERDRELEAAEEGRGKAMDEAKREVEQSKDRAAYERKVSEIERAHRDRQREIQARYQKKVLEIRERALKRQNEGRGGDDAENEREGKKTTPGADKGKKKGWDKQKSGDGDGT